MQEWRGSLLLGEASYLRGSCVFQQNTITDCSHLGCCRRCRRAGIALVCLCDMVGLSRRSSAPSQAGLVPGRGALLL